MATVLWATGTLDSQPKTLRIYNQLGRFPEGSDLASKVRSHAFTHCVAISNHRLVSLLPPRGAVGRGVSGNRDVRAERIKRTKPSSASAKPL